SVLQRVQQVAGELWAHPAAHLHLQGIRAAAQGAAGRHQDQPQHPQQGTRFCWWWWGLEPCSPLPILTPPPRGGGGWWCALLSPGIAEVVAAKGRVQRNDPHPRRNVRTISLYSTSHTAPCVPTAPLACSDTHTRGGGGWWLVVGTC